MRYFFYTLVCFIGIVLTLTLLDTFFSFGIKNNLNIKSSYVQLKKIDAELLVHGPCEPLWMISPQKIENQTGLKTYNLALSHSDFADNFLHLYLYYKKNRAPYYLLLYVTPESFDVKFNTFNTYRFANWMGDFTIASVVKEMDACYYRYSCIPFMRFAYYNQREIFEMMQGYKHYFTHKTSPYFPDGFEPPVKVRWDNHFNRFAELYPNGYYFTWDKTREKYFRKIIEFARANKTKVILYESPIYKNAISHFKNRTEIISKIKGIAKEYGIDYCIFDGMKLAEKKENFISTLNLNYTSALIFSDSLGKYLNEKYIRIKNN